MTAKAPPPEYEDQLIEATKANRIELDDYLSSVQGLHAFSDSVRWNEDERALLPDSHSSIPRTMTAVRDKELHNLTPDCVVQRDPGYGVIAEMKKHYREAGDTSAFEQIQQYDDDLLGWWTEDERIPLHDLVLLTHYLSSTKATDAYRYWESKGGEFTRCFAIVEFNFTHQASPSFTLKRVTGHLSDKAHDEALRQGKPIPERFVLDYIRRYKFYDARPPLVYVMLLIHDYVLPSLLSPDAFGGAGGVPVVVVTAEQVRMILQEQFSGPLNTSRQPMLPRRDWVESALEEFTRVKLAEPLDDVAGRSYRFVLRKPSRKDTLEFLTDRILRRTKEGAARQGPETTGGEPFQLPLFGDSDRS